MGNQNIRKVLIIVVNVTIITAILVFVVLYSRFARQGSYRLQIEHFENTTVTYGSFSR